MLIDLAFVAVCVLLPGAVMLWLLQSRAESRVYLMSIAALAGVLLIVLTLSIVGAWYVVGTFWPWFFAFTFLAILFRRVRGGLPAMWVPRRWSGEFFLTGLNVLLLGLISPVLFSLTRAEAFEGEPSYLSAPLHGETLYVMGGGANWAVNHHSFIPEQRYALDITRVSAFGFRTSTLFPESLDDFYIFGMDVLAPCDGQVIFTKSDLSNRALRDMDVENRFGNHVVLFCEGHSVMLAHMQPGSVVVSVGEPVGVGQLIGKVGNSGATLEPHLHIHAVRGRKPDGTGPASPMIIDGRFLSKGESFSN